MFTVKKKKVTVLQYMVFDSVDASQQTVLRYSAITIFCSRPTDCHLNLSNFINIRQCFPFLPKQSKLFQCAHGKFPINLSYRLFGKFKYRGCERHNGGQSTPINLLIFLHEMEYQKYCVLFY